MSDNALPEGDGTDVASVEAAPPAPAQAPIADASAAPLPDGDGAQFDTEAPPVPPPAVFVDENNQLRVSLPMSAQGYVHAIGRYYVRGNDPQNDGGTFVVLSVENGLAGWDANTPGLRPDNDDAVALVHRLATAEGTLVRDTMGRGCVVNGRMVRQMLAAAARMALSHNTKPRVRCAGCIVDLRPLSNMMGHIDDDTVVTITTAQVPVRDDLPGGPLSMPVVRFESGPAMAVLACDLWDVTNNPANPSHPDNPLRDSSPATMGSMFAVEGFVAANAPSSIPRDLPN